MEILLTIFILFVLAAAVIAAESDNFIYTTATIIASFAALDLLFGVPIWATIISNPITIIMFMFIYTVAGAVYTAFWRWPESLRECAVDIQESYESWLKKNPSSTKQDFMKSYEYKEYTASANSEKLANWILAWPFSLFWELLRKPAKWLATNVYDMLGKTFTRIGQQVTNNILRDK